MAVAEHLVGRSVELDELARLLEQLDEGRPAAAVLLGEPGIGKTRLLAELSSRAEERGHLVLAGSASELERDLPFWVFVDAVDEHVEGLPPGRLDALDESSQGELGTIFPALHQLAARREVAPQHERYHSHRAVRELLRVLAASRPLVLVLDDVHWCDPASLELLGSLLHRPPAAPVLVALAAREGQLPQRLATALERAERAGMLERVEVGALTRDEAEQLVGSAVADVYEASGGNPFYLEQLGRTLELAGAPATGRTELTLGDIAVPAAVAAALGEELSALSAGARRVLDGAAVAGDPFEPELAAAAAAVDDSAAVATLDELLRLDLVRATDVPRRFRFRHPLVRRAVYESSPGGWRLDAHERCSEFLRLRGAATTARAHHVELSGRYGDLDAVATLREAGGDAASRAPESAAHWFSAAVRLLPEAAPAETRIELLNAQASALAAAGRLGDSRGVLVECLRLASAWPAGERVALTVACARVEHLLALHEEARVRLQETLAELPDLDSAPATTLMLQLATERMYRLDTSGTIEWASRALETASALGDHGLRAEALALRSDASAWGGLVEPAQADLEEASRLIDGLSDAELASRLEASSNLAFAHWQLGRIDAATRYAERTVAIARTTGHGDLPPALLPILSAALRVRGRLEQALEVAEGAVEAGRLLHNDHTVAWALTHVSDVAFAAGDMELALEAGREAADVAERLEASVMMPSAAAVALAAPLLELGEAQRAAAVLSRFGGPELAAIPIGGKSRALELMTRCLLGAGERDGAERAVAAAADCANAVPLPLPKAMADLAQAALRFDVGDDGSAAELALAAAAALDGLGRVLDATFARMLAGKALARAGERERATPVLEQASDEFQSYGSERFRRQVDQELRRLGRTVHRRSGRGTGESGLAALTERELELAHLVVDRKTNPQIAAELFLSQKTVETHLRNIFRKVGVANRVELARAVEKSDPRRELDPR